MGKKKKKTGQSLEESLAKILESVSGKQAAPDSSIEKEIDSLAGRSGIPSEEFRKHFEQAASLAGGADPREVVKLPVSFQVAFLLLAESEQDDDLLGDILNLATDKRVKKEAKRIIHRMRSRGLSVSAEEESGGSILERRVSREDPELPCYISPVTGKGSRMIWLARYTHGGVAVYQTEINDTDGLVEFSGGVIGRNRYRQLLKDILGSDELSMLEISYSEARQRVAAAVNISREASRPLPEGYLEVSGELPEFEPVTIPEPRKIFSADEIEKAAGQHGQAAKLHDLPEFADWFPAEETLEKIQSKFKEIESSQVAINDAQRIDQVKKALDDAVSETIDEPDQRAHYQLRLFEMAAHLKQCEKPEAAMQTMAAALQLDQEDFAPLDSPFFVQLVQKLFKSPEEIVKQMKPASASSANDKKDEGEKKDPGKLIVTP